MSLSRAAALVAAFAVVTAACSDESKLPAGWKVKHPGKGQWVLGAAEIETKESPKAKVNDPKTSQKIVAKEGGSDIINLKPASDLISEEKYGDCTAEVEFLIPKGSNSGVYLMG